MTQAFPFVLSKEYLLFIPFACSVHVYIVMMLLRYLFA